MGEIEGKNQSAVGPVANTEKDAILADIANKIQALDNPVKLGILSLLVESGSLSITDISKKLDINFSTAHKYLEQLQAASLVTSKQIADNRLKRMFFIKDFNIELSPRSLFQKTLDTNNKTKPRFRVFTSTGELADFDEEAFAKKYVREGMPRGTILLALHEVLPQTYNGITITELNTMFETALEKKAENIHMVLKQLEDTYDHKRTHEHILGMVHPEAISQHMNGDIFIRNLKNPLLLNFVQSFQRIATYGITGKKPKNLNELLQQTLLAIEKAKSFTLGAQAIDAFNYLILPIIDKKEDFMTLIKNFLIDADKLNIPLFIGLDAGKLKALEQEKVDDELAEQIFSKVIDILESTQLKNIYPVIKVREKKFLEKDYSKLREFYLVNMMPAWQTENASYVGRARFDSSWRGMLRTDRIGEAQEIAVNLPRLAAKSKTIDEFLTALEAMTKQCVAHHVNMLELTVGEFLRKHKVFMPSEQTGAWSFVSAPDASYSISLVGLPNAIHMLTGNPIEKEIKLAKKILTIIPKSLVTLDYTPIRLTVKECNDEAIANRFNLLDARLGFAKEKYHPGVCNSLETCELQEFLPGGHAFAMDKKVYKTNVSSLPKTKFGTLHVW